MYLPAHFDEPRPEILHALVAAHPFGTLVTAGEGGLDAEHLPFEIDPSEGPLGTLRAHVARANPAWTAVREHAEVLVIFQAGDAYVSPNWYPSKHETHRQVPTWNYRVVHAHGPLVVREDERFLRGLLARLTRTHEASQPRPWKMGDAPADHVDALLKAVVGIEIPITRLVGKLKLGQNRETRDRIGAAEALKAAGHEALGQAMLDAVRPEKPTRRAHP